MAFLGENHNFFEQLIAQGLPYVTQYLSQKFSCNFALADRKDQNHYYLFNQSSYSVTLNKMHKAEKLTDSKYCYYPEEKQFYYLIEYKDNSFFIMATDVKSHMVEIIAEHIKDIEQDVIYYLISYQMNNPGMKNYNIPFLTSLFNNNGLDINSFFAITRKQLDPSAKYRVCVHQYNLAGKSVNINDIANYVESITRNKQAISFNFIDHDSIVSIFSPLGPDLEKTAQVNIDIHRKIQAAITDKFGIATRDGIGKAHSVDNLYKSYCEAFFACNIPILMGEESFVKSFEDLGIFSIILSNDLDVVKAYCLQTLQPILEYDRENNMFMLESLRTLLDNNLHWKDTAQQLYIHTNTLHYRIDKALKLCDKNLTDMKDIAQLYLTIKTWDVLSLLNQVRFSGVYGFVKTRP